MNQTIYNKLVRNQDDINDLASAILSPEDLQFISNPEIIKGMPLFLKSSKGKEAMALIVSEFKKYVE
jgi:hypothetical protein